jgi:hypothetical protein
MANNMGMGIGYGMGMGYGIGGMGMMAPGSFMSGMMLGALLD